MKRLVFLVLLGVFALLSIDSLAFSRPGGSYPRLASYYLSPIQVSENNLMAPQLARYDIVILDMETGAVNPGLLETIRSINPNIKLLAYMTSEEITTNPIDPVTYPLRYLLNNSIQPEWWLKTSAGAHASCWEDTWMLNCSVHCPTAYGQTWPQFFADFVTDNVLSNPLWDGFFVDNCWSVVPWLLADVDSNNDGLNDTLIPGHEWLDTQWELGMNIMLNDLMQSNPAKILIGNAGYDYGEYLNGAMIEGVVEQPFAFYDQWYVLMQRVQRMEAEFRQPQYNIINGALPAGSSSNFPYMRFCLVTALMNSSYFGIDLGQFDHSDTWWYDEYNCDLGQPISTYENSYQLLGSNMVINSDFSNGLNGWSTDYIQGTIGTLELVQEGDSAYAKCTVLQSNGVDYSAQFMQTANPNLVFENNQDYLLSFKAKADHPLQINFMVQKHTENWDWLMPGPVYTDLTPEWQDYSYLIKSINSLYSPMQLRISFNFGTEPGIVSFDNINLVHVQLQAARREFENGIVLCNPGTQSVTSLLDRTYYRIIGTQDPAVNNGQACTSVTIAPMDGIVLLNAPMGNSDEHLIGKPGLKIYPNPSHGIPKLLATIPQDSEIKLGLYNLKGQLVQVLYDGFSGAGQFEYAPAMQLNALNLSSGIYFIKLESGANTITQKLLILQ